MGFAVLVTLREGWGVFGAGMKYVFTFEWMGGIGLLGG